MVVQEAEEANKRVGELEKIKKRQEARGPLCHSRSLGSMLAPHATAAPQVELKRAKSGTESHVKEWEHQRELMMQVSHAHAGACSHACTHERGFMTRAPHTRGRAHGHVDMRTGQGATIVAGRTHVPCTHRCAHAHAHMHIRTPAHTCIHARV